jgi:hypothetical protein
MNARNVALGALLASLCACGSGEADPPTVDELNAAMEGYSAWDQIAPWVGVQESGEAHGAFVQIWWNPTAAAAIAAGGSAPMPDGSLIVQEGYTTDDPSDLAATTVMWKAADYGWFWARFNASGAVTMSGRPDGCVNCHASGDDSMLAVQR